MSPHAPEPLPHAVAATRTHAVAATRTAPGRLSAAAAWPFALTLALTTLGIAWPSGVEAQSGFFMRLSPEVSRLTVEHTKQVTIGGGSSTSTSSASGLDLSGIVAGGFRSAPGPGWSLGGEIELVVPARRLIEGTILPTPNGNPHDVWPGRWDFKDRFGVGGNVTLGRRLGESRATLDLVVGARRMWSEFATGGTNPETGVAGEDRSRLGRWPATVGVGVSLDAGRPVDVRLTYFRSSTDWVIDVPEIRLDYRYVVTGLRLSAGIAVG